MLTSALSSIYPQLINILKRLCFVVVVGRIFLLLEWCFGVCWNEIKDCFMKNFCYKN